MTPGQRISAALAFVAASPLAVAVAQAPRGPDAKPAPAAPSPAEPRPPDTSTESGAGLWSGPPDDEGETDEEHSPPPKTTTAPSKGAPTTTARFPVPIQDGMARIPGGRFTMGSIERNARANERPARPAVVPPFWIDRTEVTVGAYRACVERGACVRPLRSSTLCTFDLGDPQLPVSCVPWASARTYCLAIGKRLPTEVEWELAARGTAPVRYPWGGGWASCSLSVTLVNDRTQKSCSKTPARVGSHPVGASVFGIFDMSGNVEEWVADWYTAALRDLSPRSGASHVLRGGGWLSPPSLAKATSRNWGSVREAGPNVGFRCARDD